MPIPQDATGQAVDLNNCDREPIHIPGRIQSHGVLLALSEDGPDDWTIDQASRNAAEWLGVPAVDLLGRPLSELIAPASWPSVLDHLRSADRPDLAPLSAWAGLDPHRLHFDAIAHRSDGVLILEMENGRAEGPERGRDSAREIRRMMARLQGAAGLIDFCQVAAREMRSLTGFDRVTVYRFDAQWNGEVIAEDRVDDLEPLFGLHFPASDIPEQARRLYALNPIRYIAASNAEPSDLSPVLNPRTGAPLDLSFAALRSVSPIHIQYLKNMGATSSMSVSLVRDGRLWGLLSCLTYGPEKYVPLEVRATCEFLGVLVSVQLAIKEDSEDQVYKDRLRDVRERLMRNMSEVPDLFEALLGRDPNLVELTGAQGAAVVFDGRCAAVGQTPDDAQIKRLVQWLKVHTDGEVFHTDQLPRLFPEAEEYKDRGCGLVSIATSKAQGYYVLWFRPEVIQTVDWGGNPNKPVGQAEGGYPLSPRTSFDLWKEVVQLKSLPWKPGEVEAARALRDAIIAVVIRRAEELTRLNAELERSNTDLDAFAYIASHDLKEPLRGIHNYSTFLLEDYAGKLDDDGQAKLGTLVRLSRRMEDLIESLLRYSRLGREGWSVEPVDLHDLVAETLEGLTGRIIDDGNRVEIRIPRRLPEVQGDRVSIGEVFGNLIANAIKYNDKDRRWVEIGYQEPMASTGADDAPARPSHRVFHVKDNGIGIAEKHASTIFRLFKRLHGRDKFGGGTGAGLTIAKKIVERHGGALWVESTPGEGSTFYFTLQG